MVSFRAVIASLGLIAASKLPSCLAYPTENANVATSPNPQYNEGRLVRRAEPGDFYLRIMPLGASITAGSNFAPDDEGENGYRKYLRDRLRADEWDVNMVGNHHRGTMRDSVSSTPNYPSCPADGPAYVNTNERRGRTK